jgi:CheY-like chemotaxis protein
MKKNILTVDENKAMNFLLETVLLKRYTLTAAQNSFSAMKVLSLRRDFELIIISINELESENFELLQHISSSTMLKHIPVVVLSNSDDEKLKQLCKQQNVVGFLKKPFDPISLVEKIDAALLSDEEPGFAKKKIFNLNFY